jgi:CubicO group peptidase (beta-lactamase class C family)
MKTCTVVVFALVIRAAFAQLPAATQTAIDQATRKVLAETDSISASIAVVKDGKVAYVQAYGDAHLDPKAPASPGMRYKIGSNTKKFIATAVLLLAEEGKVTLDDRVSRFIPGLTRGDEVTIRQLLSHTSGYQDYYPLDYVAPFMTHATTMQGMKPFGTPSSFTQTGKGDRGGMTDRSFSIRAGAKSLRLTTFFTPEGQISQYLIYPVP